MLEINNLQKRFKNGTLALNNVSFSVKRGEFISILGPSGSGKTTLLRSINGLENIEKGEIIFNNKKINVDNMPEVQKKTGMIFQEFNLINNLSSINNVLTGLLNTSSKFLSIFYLFTKKQKLNALQALDTVGLLEKSYNRADELSGGERQRVGIARAIIKKPLLLLVDEPVASLDPKSALAIMKLLRNINKNFNITILCNLHQFKFASQFSDRVIGLSNGSIVFDDDVKFLEKNIIKLYNENERRL